MHIYDPDSSYLSDTSNNNTKFLLPKLEVFKYNMNLQMIHNSVMHIEFNADAQAGLYICCKSFHPYYYEINASTLNCSRRVHCVKNRCYINPKETA